MSSKPRNGMGDYEMLRAAVEQKEWCENEHSVVVTATISLRSRPCVLLVHLEAKEGSKARGDTHICSYEVEWPNAGTYSWPATLFQAYVKLDRMVEEYRNSESFMLTGYKG